MEGLRIGVGSVLIRRQPVLLVVIVFVALAPLVEGQVHDGAVQGRADFVYEDTLIASLRLEYAGPGENVPVYGGLSDLDLLAEGAVSGQGQDVTGDLARCRETRLSYYE